MPRYGKKDYALVSGVLKTARESIEGDKAHTAVSWVMLLFAEKFTRDNPKGFDEKAFNKACFPDEADKLY